jgi:hypothetical protein
MLVARVVDSLASEQMDVGVAVLSPSGRWPLADDPGHGHVEVTDEYVLVTLRDAALTEEGTVSRCSWTSIDPWGST